jgi:hypothetical protein
MIGFCGASKRKRRRLVDCRESPSSSVGSVGNDKQLAIKGESHFQPVG